jgi:hypothetical protein
MNLTTLAIKYVIWRLRKDKDWWRSYQATISMCVYDALMRGRRPHDETERIRLYELCNEGATNFMNLWTGTKEVVK